MRLRRDVCEGDGVFERFKKVQCVGGGGGAFYSISFAGLLLVCCWFVAFVCRDTLLNDLEHSAWYGI